MRNGFITAMAVAALAVAGCGGGKEGIVAGSVTLGGAPLTQQGMITFVAVPEGDETPNSFNANIRDGQYTSPPMPAGAYRVSVSVSGRIYAATPATVTGHEPPPKQIALDPKYADPATSGLTFTVQPGKNDWSFDLEVAAPVAN